MITGFFQDLNTYLDKGGPVMWVLAVLALVLWYVIGLRAVTLRRGSAAGVSTLLRRALDEGRTTRRGIVDRAAAAAAEAVGRGQPRLGRALDDALWDLRSEMGTGRALVHTIVAVAPLLGLLGTVSGMIETFESLGGMEFYSASGGVAGGISEALFTTQMGLAVSVPGLIVGRILDRRENRMNQELDEIRDAMLARAEDEEAA